MIENRIWILMIFAVLIQSCSSTKFVTNGDTRSVNVQFDGSASISNNRKLMNTLNYIRDVDGSRGSIVKIIIYKTNKWSADFHNTCLDIMEEHKIEYRNSELANIEKFTLSVFNKYKNNYSLPPDVTINADEMKQQIKMLAARDWNLKKHLLKKGDAGIGSNSNDIYNEDEFEGDVTFRFEVAPERKKNNEGVVYYKYR